MAKKKYEKSFFIKMNMQNPPKPHSMNWYIRKAVLESNPEYTVCGYEFTTDRKQDSFGITEGNSPELNFRMAFLPEEGHYWMSRDFSGQELRIMANLSGEETWINAFNSGEDIHKATAYAIWGKENYNSERRKAAKTINFGLLYGAGAGSLSEQLGISVEEAQSYLDTFFEKLPAIHSFLNSCKAYATKHKMISNINGRKRRLKSYIKHDGTLMNAGARKSFNHPIQSMGADIIKEALIKIYYNILLKDKYRDKVYFMNTIHDEANLSVQKDIIEEVAYETEKAMVYKMKDRPVLITTGLEIGNNMGLTWEFEQDKETLELRPVYKPIDSN